jgi:hypothetical protein
MPGRKAQGRNKRTGTTGKGEALLHEQVRLFMVAGLNPEGRRNQSCWRGVAGMLCRKSKG